MTPEAVARLDAFWVERENVRAGLSAFARANIENRWKAVFGPEGPWERCVADLASMGISRDEAILQSYQHPQQER